MDTWEVRGERASDVCRSHDAVGRDHGLKLAVDGAPSGRMMGVIARLPVAVVATAVASAGAQRPVAGVIAMPAAAALAGATVTDLRRHMIPARWVDFAAVATIVALGLHGVAGRTSDHLVAGLVLAAATWVIWWMIRVTSGNGLGYGDVRLATLAALPLGGLWGSTALLLTPAVFLVAAALILPLRAVGEAGRLPLAPAIAVAWGGVLCMAAVAAVPVGNIG